MVKRRAYPTANAVCQPLRGADALEQTGRKAAAEGLIKNLSGVVVRVIAPDTQVGHVDGTLVHVLFWNLVITGLSRLEFDFLLFYRLSLRPIAVDLAKFGFHRGRIKVADDAQDNVVGMYVGVMPVDQILARDRGNRSVFGFTSVRIVRAISQF